MLWGQVLSCRKGGEKRFERLARPDHFEDQDNADTEQYRPKLTTRMHLLQSTITIFL